ncbi:antitoxin Xre-like helix-turn-helix domain-containing protein [Vibrio tetraodonis]|uniref:type II RES/Xre toxin-antitoxin system antitoxin n=1 Tax=Vibrio tetraodonis TaxID=2231647 RepID=UPI000E0A0F1D|nr:antitoxin Xre-like helix-turn-helix domain-containing protein [Vibrio tetraodonis]
MFSAAYEMLGGEKRKAQSVIDSLKIIRQGLPVKTLDRGMLTLGLTKKDYAKIIGVNLRTLQRKMKEPNATLSPTASEHALMLAGMVKEADEYFGDRDVTLRWLNKPSLVFENETPLSLCDTKTGIILVTEEINKLTYGYTA